MRAPLAGNEMSIPHVWFSILPPGNGPLPRLARNLPSSALLSAAFVLMENWIKGAREMTVQPVTNLPK
jgi:hypothetical protein